MSLTAEPTGRRASAPRSHATSPVETSSTIAFGAWIARGQSRASPEAGAISRSAAATASAAAGRRRTLTAGA